MLLLLDYHATIISTVPAEKEAAKISSTDSAKPLSNIWSASSKTMCLGAGREGGRGGGGEGGRNGRLL